MNEQETSRPGERDDIVYPDGLTEKDRELIYAQCEHQNATSKEQVEGFANAYKTVKELALSAARVVTLTPADVMDLIMRLAATIEFRNAHGFRTVPVRFPDMSFAVPSHAISHLMNTFVGNYADRTLKPDEAYREFERIHPFEDGNGRTGDLLWKLAVARETGEWPERLPPPYKLEGGGYESGFGEVEK